MTELIEVADFKKPRKGSAIIKIIETGWGSSGYYPAEVLARDGRVFSKGTQMFLNHATPLEDAERPEGDLNNLVGVLTSDAEYKDGALYAKVDIYPHYQPLISYIGKDIGVSIRASGTVTHGEADGREGNIVETIDGVKSIDFVTKAGAGGKIMSLVESQKEHTMSAELTETMRRIEEAETRIKKQEELLEAANKKNSELQEELLKERQERLYVEARGVIQELLDESHLPGKTKARLARELDSKITLNEKGVDYDALRGNVRETIQEAYNELQEANPTGVIRGMGSTFMPDEDYDQRLRKGLAALGMNEAAIDCAMGVK